MIKEYAELERELTLEDLDNGVEETGLTSQSDLRRHITHTYNEITPPSQPNLRFPRPFNKD
jgi:hypothetical protein